MIVKHKSPFSVSLGRKMCTPIDVACESSKNLTFISKLVLESSQARQKDIIFYADPYRCILYTQCDHSAAN